ncbi:MAG: hypothetical protein HY537_10500, partial [Deltaproteobacteria bacterium]|nr:hypothetical protein [Deltaproteobacteria bacterium]
MLIVILLAGSANLFSEDAQTNDQLLQAMRAQVEQRRMEEGFKNPKKPVIEKNRAVLGKRSAPIVVVT